VDDGLRSERLALPLAEAAVRLGISAETLCRRLDSGEVRGFERDGTSFVYVDDLAAGGRAPKEGAGGQEAGRRFGGAAAEPPTDGTLPVVVEFQKMELTRLLRENERLNARLDQLFDEIRHLRDMQQREQILRQQEQALRRQNQETLDRLTSRPALLVPPRSEAPEAPQSLGLDKPRPELVLTRTVASKRPAKTQPPTETQPPTPPKPTPTHHPEPAVLATGPDRREPHAVMPKLMPSKPVTRGFAVAPASAPTPALAPAPVARAAEDGAAENGAAEDGATEDGAVAPEEAAELAMILNDIGHSLRDSEAFRRYPPIKPGSIPQRAGDRRPASVLPRRAVPPIHTPASDHTRERPVKTLSVEETALVAILDSMGPTAEDRRTAARDVRRLLRIPSSTSEP